ncbi:hypothetical protein L1987_12687 [Smallanthus sonchifolius]|uniref:Uncharacterized protein n=1 Tax=Smallanthus sonchifolius TaxID=185202 RepID=A0ACB9JGR4_9ASTR|nr:hypothetical protein L1987_12687 [Smallanthus sonchifolius]
MWHFQNHDSPPLPPLLPFFFLTALPAQPDSSTYTNCPSYKCGDVNISYPFWMMDRDDPAQVCGYHGFGINCVDNRGRSYPEITLGHHSYYVHNIDNGYRSILLSDTNVSSFGPGPIDCPRVRHGINLQTLPLNFSMLNVNLSFHYNCNGFPSFATEIPCLQLEKTQGKSYVHVMHSSIEETDWDAYSCADQVVTAVIGEHIHMFPDLSRQLGEILDKGFQLQWRMDDDDCENCEDSGGRISLDI